MAKSLRSKIKRAHRTTKRQLVFQPTEDKRLERLAKKQAECLETAKQETSQESNTMDVIEQTETIQPMETELVFSSRAEKDAFFLSRNQFKKKMRAKSSKRRSKVSKK